MITRLNRLICIVLSVIMISALFSACSSENSVDGAVDTKIYEKDSLKGEELVSGIVYQNEFFAVEWQNETKRVIFHDLKNNTKYSTIPSEVIEKQYDEDGEEIRNNPRIESAIAVTHFSSTNLTEITINSAVGAVKNGEVVAQPIEEGIRVIYDFPEAEIIVPVDYTVNDKYFSVSVNPAEICDNGKDYVTRISIAPFMCGVNNESETEEYLFLPDGSGAIIKPRILGAAGVAGEMPVYGGDEAIGQMLYNTYTEQCYMPVYGMKSGNKGLCAIIDSSAERSYINWEVGSSNLRYSSVYPTFNIRGYNLIEQPGGFAAYAAHLKVFNEYIANERLTVNYYPFYGENCGYNDMANIYRDYLKEKYSFKSNSEEDLKLSLELVGGIEEKKFFCGIPYMEITSLTTVSQAKKIAKYFGDLTDDLAIRLCGFTESGLDVGKVAGGFEISSKLGSKKDIEELLSLCKKYGIEISLEFDTTSFNKSGNGYSLKKSAALFSDYELNLVSMYNPVTRNTNGVEYGLVSRRILSSVLEKIENKAGKYGFSCIGVGTLGKLCYSDYSQLKTANCDNIQEDTATLISNISENKRVVLTGANDYSAVLASHIADVPISSSDYDVVTYDVPFYSMVFKGYIPMSSGALNTAADSNQTLLQCIESGIAPTYSVIYDFPRSAITSKYVATRSADFENIGKDIENVISRTNKLYDAVSGKKIESHSIINDNLRAVNYSDGITVYINYGEISETVNGVTVPNQDFVLIGG